MAYCDIFFPEKIDAKNLLCPRIQSIGIIDSGTVSFTHCLRPEIAVSDSLRSRTIQFRCDKVIQSLLSGFHMWMCVKTYYYQCSRGQHPFTSYFDVHQGYKVLTQSHVFILHWFSILATACFDASLQVGGCFGLDLGAFARKQVLQPVQLLCFFRWFPMAFLGSSAPLHRRTSKRSHCLLLWQSCQPVPVKQSILSL